jgi:hypothetical protein
MNGLATAILSSIWHRNRIVLRADSGERADSIFFELRPFIPQYRQLIFCGQIPKEARFLRNAKFIETADLNALRRALVESFAEEEMGAPPVQVVFFQADRAAFMELLAHLDRGWMATTRVGLEVLSAASLPPVEEIKTRADSLALLDPLPQDMSLEDRIMEDTKSLSGAIKAFRIQSKQGQVHLAFQAIQAELESTPRLTQSYLQETLRLRENTLKKVLEIGRRERRVDLSSYIEETPGPMIEFLKKISAGGGLSQAVVFDGGNLLGFARFGDIELPSRYFLLAWQIVARLEKDGLPLGPCRFIELKTTGQVTVLFYNHRYLFGFIPARDADLAGLKLNIESELVRVWGTVQERS